MARPLPAATPACFLVSARPTAQGPRDAGVGNIAAVTDLYDMTTRIALATGMHPDPDHHGAAL
ncbi:hypothetical protein [Frigidibacter sp.]|uniref:hypothetical protein n=1 Tax=Frigidibacter sp. TaxID=2586418 RepID=UPI002733F036|nr:hypothetical protein [Frigidibacter sp.]MDP3341867.1 hypothetical protein [Frigidibacter sp.]